MMYSNKFVMCVLVNGEIQKEKANGVVALPFSTEYQLRLRNKHNRRAVVKLYIDGENISGGGYVIAANGYIDLKRHHDVDRAFKFTSLDSTEAYDHGKNGPNDDKVKGTIEARFYLEKEHPVIPWVMPVVPSPPPKPYAPDWPTWPYNPTPTWGPNPSPWISYTCQNGGGGTTCSMGNPNVNFPTNLNYTPINEQPLQDGCTVEGSYTGQSFYNVNVDLDDTYTSVKIFLQGFKAEGIQTVKLDTKYCDNCGAKTRKKKSNFCHICGKKI